MESHKRFKPRTENSLETFGRHEAITRYVEAHSSLVRSLFKALCDDEDYMQGYVSKKVERVRAGDVTLQLCQTLSAFPEADADEKDFGKMQVQILDLVSNPVVQQPYRDVFNTSRIVSNSTIGNILEYIEERYAHEYDVAGLELYKWDIFSTGAKRAPQTTYLYPGFRLQGLYGDYVYVGLRTDEKGIIEESDFYTSSDIIHGSYSIQLVRKIEQ